MKRRALLFTLLAGISYLGLTGYSSGPAGGGLGNRTTTGCGGGGCHANNTSATTASVALLDGGLPVTKYTPGKTYTIAVAGTNSGSLPRFGFQVVSVKASATSTQAGTFAVGSATGIAIRNVSGLQIMEHTASQAAITPGTYLKQFNWTAPAAGTGSVTFNVVLNAVNANGGESGDAPNVGAVTFPEATVSVAGVTRDLQFRMYPNPVAGTLHLSVSSVEAGTYELAVYSLTGQQVRQQGFEVTGTTRDISIDVQDWSSGVYQLQLSRNGVRQLATFVKQ